MHSNEWRSKTKCGISLQRIAMQSSLFFNSLSPSSPSRRERNIFFLPLCILSDYVCVFTCSRPLFLSTLFSTWTQFQHKINKSQHLAFEWTPLCHFPCSLQNQISVARRVLRILRRRWLSFFFCFRFFSSTHFNSLSLSLSRFPGPTQ